MHSHDSEILGDMVNYNNGAHWEIIISVLKITLDECDCLPEAIIHHRSVTANHLSVVDYVLKLYAVYCKDFTGSPDFHKITSIPLHVFLN